MRQGIKEKDIRDFEKYANKLSDVLSRIREYKPEANAYLSCGCVPRLNLMSDEHLKYPHSIQQDFIVIDVIMDGFDGGDW